MKNHPPLNGPLLLPLQKTLVRISDAFRGVAYLMDFSWLRGLCQLESNSCFHERG